MIDYRQQIRNARGAQKELFTRSSKERKALVESIAQALEEHSTVIQAANEKDMYDNPTLSKALVDRLRLTDLRIRGIAKSMRAVASLPSPLDACPDTWKTDANLQINKVAVPLGVIAIIYEARPNVTIDAVTLALLSGNAVVLRGSTSARHSNVALVQIVHSVLEQYELSKDLVVLMPSNSRTEVDELLSMRGDLDLIIPRGGKDLIEHVVAHSCVPVIETGAGVCHVYIDQSADRDMAVTIAVNAKTQRPSVCNAAETILIHKEWNPENIIGLVEALQKEGVEVRGCAELCSLVPSLSLCTIEDWKAEYLSLCISIRLLDSITDACAHIEIYGTRHSEAIISEDAHAVEYFFNHVDSAVLYHNASTRFTDGGEFGFGSEMGISTQKLHVRGPLGLRHLVSYQYRVLGNGTIRT